jgi:hypothetical protein
MTKWTLLVLIAVVELDAQPESYRLVLAWLVHVCSMRVVRPQALGRKLDKLVQRLVPLTVHH